MKELPNETLLRRLAEGREAYREELYEEMMAEARARDLDCSDQALEEIRQMKKEHEVVHLVRLGFGIAVLGGVFAILIGVYLMFAKIRDPDGRRGYKYAEAVRTHGRSIVIVGMIFMLITAPYLSRLLGGG